MATDDPRLAVLDIGSNSIRLVVYDSESRPPIALYNERVIGRLGKGLARTGRLDPEAVDFALVTLERFCQVTRALGLRRVALLATAAVREAEDGEAFTAAVERRCGYPVTVLDGEEEARLSAVGVLSATPEAEGVMGDLGGGSLELTRLHDGAVGQRVSLPVGPLRLVELNGGSMDAARKEVDRALREVPWLDELRGGTFYAVGGAWRALAQVQMARTDYPLRIIQGYGLSADDAVAVARWVAGATPAQLARFEDVPKRRAETLPWSAAVLERVIETAALRRVSFSVFGLREGYLFEQLPEGLRASDALLIAAKQLADPHRPGFDPAEPLLAWTAPLFADETPVQARLRAAACALSDIAWQEHPEYRATVALDRILHSPRLTLDHPSRAFLALAVFYRYGGERKAPEAAVAQGLTPSATGRRARLLGAALRLGHKIAAGSATLLAATSIAVEGDATVLRLPSDVGLSGGGRRRLEALAKAAGCAQALVQGGMDTTW